MVVDKNLILGAVIKYFYLFSIILSYLISSTNVVVFPVPGGPYKT